MGGSSNSSFLSPLVHPQCLLKDLLEAIWDILSVIFEVFVFVANVLPSILAHRRESSAVQNSRLPPL